MKNPLTEDQIYSLWVDFQWGLGAPEEYMQGFEDGFCIGLRWLIENGYVSPTEKAIKLDAKYKKTA